MTKDELNKYAELLISMSTDYLIGRIEESHYINMIQLVSDKINKPS